MWNVGSASERFTGHLNKVREGKVVPVLN